MFESMKLSIYGKHLIGFGYDAPKQDKINYENHYYINTYLVLQKDEKLSFIKYKSYYYHADRINEGIEFLESYGYRPLSEYTEQKQNIKRIK